MRHFAIYLLVFIAMLFSSNGSYASSDPDNCRAVSIPMTRLADELRSITSGMSSLMDTTLNATQKFEGEERKSLEMLEEKWRAASSSWEDFVTALEEASFVMKRCARK